MNKLIMVPAILLSFMSGGSAQEIRSAEQIVQASCAACHGIDGNQPAAADFPRLGGQHKEYLEKALNDYIAGRRNNEVMREQVVDNLTGKSRLSEHEVKSLADYFSRKSGLFIR